MSAKCILPGEWRRDGTTTATRSAESRWQKLLVERPTECLGDAIVVVLFQRLSCLTSRASWYLGCCCLFVFNWSFICRLFSAFSSAFPEESIQGLVIQAWSLRHYLRAQSRGYHTIDHLEERGVDRRSARWSSVKGRKGAIVNQTNIGSVSKATLGKPLRDGVERIWAFSSA